MMLQEQIEGWRKDGLLDDKGVFTLSPGELFAGFRGERIDDRDRYLSLIIGTGLVCHASSISVDRSASQLLVRMPGAYLRKEDLQQSLFQLFSSSPTRGSDLILGLLIAGSFDAERAAVEVCHPELPSYRWSSESPDEYEDLEVEAGIAELMIVTIDFDASWLEDLVEWLEDLHQPEDAVECLSVAKICRYSVVDIEIEGRKINTPLTLGQAPVALVRGESPPVADFQGTLLQRPAAVWAGVVALDKGPLHFVVRGLRYDGPGDLRLRGLVVCDALSVDPARQEIVIDKHYRAVVDDLEEMRSEMLARVDLSRVSHEWGLEMRDFFLEPKIHRELSQDAKGQVAKWLDLIPQGDDFEEQLSQLRFLYRVAEMYQKSGDVNGLEIVAEKAYQRARLMFDDVGRSLELIDMCAQLCHWLGHRRAEAYGWELLAASRALRKEDERVEERLLTVYRNPVGHLGKAMATMALSAYLKNKGKRRQAREYSSLLEEELKALNLRLEREELLALSVEKPDVVLATLSAKFSHLALYDKELRRAVEGSI
jgi:hypothetical protein